MELSEKITLAHQMLSVSERKVAEYLLQNIDIAPRMSIGSVAKEAEVSVPTVTRLAKKLGYDGFMDFRLALVAEATENAPADKTDLNSDINSHFERTIRAIVQTSQAVSADDIYEVVNAVLNSGRVFIIVSDVSLPYGMGMSEKLLKLGIDTTLITDNAALPATLQKNVAGDLFLILSCSRRSKATLEALKLISEYSANTVFLCNYMNTAAHSLANKFISTSRIDSLDRTVSFAPDITMSIVLNLMLELLSQELRYKSESTLPFQA